MSDLGDDEATRLVVDAKRIIDRLTNGFGVKSVTYNFLPTMRAMADWIERHRAAIVANRERVRQVVREAALFALGERDDMGRFERAVASQTAETIANRCAEQLATAVRLSTEEREVLLRMRKSIRYDGQFSALLDRLIGDPAERRYVDDGDGGCRTCDRPYTYHSAIAFTDPPEFRCPADSEKKP